MRRLFSYLKRYRGRYAAGILCLLATATFATGIPWLLKRAVEAVERRSEPREVTAYVGLVVLLALAQIVVRTLSRALIFNVGRDVEYDLRNDLFAHLERLSPSYYQRQQTGDLMSRLVNDIGSVRMMLGPGILNLVNTPVYYLYAVTIMLALDVPLTLLALSVYPGVLWIVKRFSRDLMERTLDVQEGLAELSARVQENLAGMTVVKAYALEEAEIDRFRAMNEDFQRRNLELARVRGLIAPVMKLVSSAGILVVLWFGGWQVMRRRIGIGDLVAFVAYLHLLAWPTMALGWMLSILQRGRAAMMRLEQIFAAEPEIVGPPGDGGSIERGEIELRGVRFSYPGPRRSREVLRGVDLRVRAGEAVAIVGRTGAGKSTLANLLPRLFDPTEGEIWIDGREIRTIPLATLRRSLGVVPQDPFLFSTTLRENIAYGLADGEELDRRIAAAAEIAGLSPDLERLPDGLETLVGERGVALSGGQKQRVTLARAVAVDPKILILDDAFSSVDGETERRILARLAEAFPGRTRWIVSHRASTLRSADRIVVLDDGRVVETGTHEELLARGGVYAEIFRRHALEDELEAL
jgi:ATP-binding cassette subfamily B protein